MFLSRVASLFLVSVVPGFGALITHHTDLVPGSPVVNGTIAADEYGPANSYAYTGGGTGFGGQLGPATLYMKSDAVYLYLGFSNLGIPTNGNQFLIYFHTRPGGFQPNGAMSDASDSGRRNVSFLSTGGVEAISFDNGSTNSPDFALLFNNQTNGFSALFELKGAGQLHGLVSHTRSALGSSNIEFRARLSDLSLSQGNPVDIAALEISSSGFLSNEGIPATGLTNNPGFNNGNTTIFTNFHRFTSAYFGPQVGLTQRVANSTLLMPATLPAAFTSGYTTVETLDGLRFTNPVCITSPPGETNRLFIVEQAGRIIVVTNLAAPTRTVFMDIASRVLSGGERGLLGLAFHPSYASNRYFYVFYTAQSGGSNRVSRFQTSPTNDNVGMTASELILINQTDDAGNHNGGDLHFGPDGYLYIALGDEGGANDSLNNSQFIDKDFFSGILRIDVDNRPGSLPPNPHPAIAAPTNYAVPPDNPFIGVTNFNGTNVNPSAVRTEFWAVGLRNPWRIAFDEATGELYCGDVGQGAREEVDLIRKGGNYGWKWREGKIATPGIGTPPPGFTNWNDPILDYTRGSATNQGFVITGGRVYRGNNFPELVGRYIFCDYSSGHIWSLTHDGSGTNATSFIWLANFANISAFGRDPSNGDILLAGHTTNRIRRLVRATLATNSLPQTLADTGVFFDTATLTPHAGIVPYDLNVPFWSDNAIKRRWFSVPSTNLHIDFDPEQPWGSPTGTVWIKHFDLLLTSGVPSSARRIETRILVKNSSGAGGYGVTYRWGDSTNNAALVGAEGLNESFVINDGGTIRTQVWRYPSQAECLQCHRADAGFALGFNTLQLNRDRDYDGVVTNQLRALNAVGYFSTNVTGFHTFRALAHATNAAASLEYRARSYLQVNCAQCHFPGGPTPAPFTARIATPLSQAGIVNGPLINTMGNTNNRVVVPGVPTNSMLLSRISIRGANQMPPLASTLVDTQGIALITAWLTGPLTNYQSFADWQIAHFGSTNAPGAGADEDFDADGAGNYQEWLTSTSPTNDLDAWGIRALRRENGAPRIVFDQIANRGFLVESATNLVENNAWRPLDVPGSRPLPAAATMEISVDDMPAADATNKFYRVSVFEP